MSTRLFAFAPLRAILIIAFLNTALSGPTTAATDVAFKSFQGAWAAVTTPHSPGAARDCCRGCKLHFAWLKTRTSHRPRIPIIGRSWMRRELTGPQGPPGPPGTQGIFGSSFCHLSGGWFERDRLQSRLNRAVRVRRISKLLHARPMDVCSSLRATRHYFRYSARTTAEMGRRLSGCRICAQQRRTTPNI